MTLEETTQLYASVLRQLLPTGGYDTSPNTEALAVDVYAHAKLLAQTDLDAKRLLNVLEELPPELLPEFETEYGLPLKCSINAGRTIEERLEILKWLRTTRNVLNRTYLEQILAIFGVELFEVRKFKPMQCTVACNAPVNTEQLRYKVLIVIPDDVVADLDCIIENYLPGYLRFDVLKKPLIFQTSRPYPLYFIEGLTTDFEMTGMQSKVVLNEADTEPENVSTSFAMIGMVVGGQINNLPLFPENISTSFAMTGMVVADPLVSMSAGTESIGTSFAMTAMQVQYPLINYSNSQPENISTSFAMTGMVVET